MRRLNAAAVAAVFCIVGLAGQWPSSVGAQSSATATATLPPPEVLGDCTDAVPVIVASDAAAQSDIYSAITLAGVLGPNRCIVLAGGRDEPFPSGQLARFELAAAGGRSVNGYVVGGPAAVPDSKLPDPSLTRVFGKDRWETALAVGAVAAKLAAGSDGETTGDGDGDGEEPGGDMPAWQRRLVREFSEALREDAAPDGMCMSLYRNGVSVFEAQAHQPLLPASLIKLATATAALADIGSGATFETHVAVSDASLELASDGVLEGHIYLVGGGDPVLATPGYIARIADTRPYTDVTKLADSVIAALRSHGIHTVSGAVVGDGSWFSDGERDYATLYLDDADPEFSAPVWKQSYLAENLAGPLSGLVINDGYSPYRTDRRAHTRSADPAVAAASDFDDLLEARGLVIRRRPRSGAVATAGSSTVLASISSPPLADLLVRILRFSENTPAEMLFKQIGRHHGDSSRAGSARAVVETLGDILGSAADELDLVDGSGLSAHNRMSCELAVQLLLHAGADSRLVAALSIAGQTPTLRSCGPQPPAAGGSTNTVLAKGGQLNDSTSLAGVSVARSGDVLTFAMIANAKRIIELGSCNSLRQLTLDAIGRFTYGPQG